MKPFFGLLPLVLLLTACQTSLITDLAVPSGATLFKDDFSDPSSGWPRQVGASGIEDYAKGVYQFDILSPNYDMWAVPGQDFSDVVIEADATWLGGPDANKFGLVCRYHDPHDFYFFIISSDGYYTIGKYMNGKSSLLGQDMMAYNSYIKHGSEPNHLRFDCSGSTLTGYVNNQMVAMTDDSSIKNGDAGLIAGSFTLTGVEIAFSNFKVVKP